MANRKNVFVFIGLFVCAFALESCHQRSYVEVLRGKTMGTTYNISVFTQKRNQLTLVQEKIDALLIEINQEVSTYIEDSQISRFNQGPKEKTTNIGHHFGKSLQTALKIAASTKGIYDPTIGPLVNLWGFGPRKTKTKPTEIQIQAAQEAIGYRHIDLHIEGKNFQIRKHKTNLAVDLSSIAKGYAVDQIARYLLTQGYINYLVEIGGEMRALGKKGTQPWFVAIEKPLEGIRAPYKGFALEDQSIATSGNYRNFFTENGITYAHTLNPITGKPAKSTLLSASVLDKSCMKADGLSTALMAMGDTKAITYVQQHNLNALLIFRDPTYGLVHKTFGTFKTKVKTR